MRCAYHPDVETNLRCGKCGKAICPKCLVQTPVGARCPDCARLYKLPTYRGEVVSLFVNRKRGTRLAIVGGIAVVVSYLVSILVPWGFSFVLFDLLALALGIFVAVTRLR